MTYQYCPKCGAKYADAAAAPYRCEACDYVVYENSRPTASALIVDGEGRLLLGRRRIEPSKGKWDVIGGFLEPGEHPDDGAKREAKEETGYDVVITEYLGTFMDEYHLFGEVLPTLNMAYVVRAVGGEPRADDDIEELRWFGLDEIPEDIAFESGKRMIDAWRRDARLHGV